MSARNATIGGSGLAARQLSYKSRAIKHNRLTSAELLSDRLALSVARYRDIALGV